MVKIKEKKKKKKRVVKIFSGSVFSSIVHAASADHLTASSKNERNKKGARNCVSCFAISKASNRLRHVIYKSFSFYSKILCWFLKLQNR